VEVRHQLVDVMNKEPPRMPEKLEYDIQNIQREQKLKKKP